MLKNKAHSLSQKMQGLSLFDRGNLIIALAFFIIAVTLPVSYINPLGPDSQTTTLRIISLEYRKTSIIILLLLAINIGMSINGNFRSWFLKYTGIGNDIYARLLQKGIIFILFIFFGEIIIQLRTNLTQTINLALGYYILAGLLIVGLIIDFLFLQRNYKIKSAHENSKLSVIRDEYKDESQQSFKNLFDE